MIISVDHSNITVERTALIPVSSPTLDVTDSILSSLYISACDPAHLPHEVTSNAPYATLFSPTSSSIQSVSHYESSPVYLSLKKKYKPVDKKIHPVTTTLPQRFRIIRNITGNPLQDLPTLNPLPLPYQPSSRYTPDRKNIIDKNHDGDFLWPQERNLLHDFM